MDPYVDEATLIEQIDEFKLLKSAAAAGQARAAAALDARRRADESTAGVPRAKQGQGVAAEVALARRDPPSCGGRHLGFAKALVNEMPHTGCTAVRSAVGMASHPHRAGIGVPERRGPPHPRHRTLPRCQQARRHG